MQQKTNRSTGPLRASLLLPALLSLATVSSAQEVIVLRSGTVGGGPGIVPTQANLGGLDDHLTYYSTTSCCDPLSSLAFNGDDFSAAKAGPPAELIIPGTTFVQTLSADPLARWVNSSHGAITGAGSGRPPRSVLYAYEFEVQTPDDPLATLHLSWAVDDNLGDTSGPNTVGAYINGQALDSVFSGGNLLVESTAQQSDVQLQTGSNTLYLYQRDTDSVVSGLIFSMTVSIQETVCLRSGMVGGQPGIPPTQANVGPIDDSVTCLVSSISTQPLSFFPFTPNDFAAAVAGSPAKLIQPGTGYAASIPSDPDARWINHEHGIITTSGSGRPPRSVLYAIPFEIATPGDPSGKVTLSWSVDDVLGDVGVSGGPNGANPIGAYVNGTPLSTAFSGGSLAAVSTASQSSVPLKTGTNYLYLYGRDTAAIVSGLLFSACISVDPAYPTFADLGGASPGEKGNPVLAGATIPGPGGSTELELSNAWPNAGVLLFISDSLGWLPLAAIDPTYCGVLQTFPGLATLSGIVSPDCTEAWEFPAVPGLPTSTYYAQALVLEFTAACPLPVSNVLQFDF